MKNSAIENMLKNMAPNRGTGLCATCGSDKTKDEDFTDDLSRKEYTISFMCQKCQDEFFIEDEEDF